MALGQAVRDLRSARGVSQEDLAHLSGMHRTYLGGIERGTRNPSFTNLARLADALEVRPSELLALAETLDERADRRARDGDTRGPGGG